MKGPVAEDKLVVDADGSVYINTWVWVQTIFRPSSLVIHHRSVHIIAVSELDSFEQTLT